MALVEPCKHCQEFYEWMESKNPHMGVSSPADTILSQYKLFKLFLERLEKERANLVIQLNQTGMRDEIIALNNNVSELLGLFQCR